MPRSPRVPKIYQIKITLQGLRPAVWRRFLVQSDLDLYRFHTILQTVMGWTNSHLHLYRIGEKDYTTMLEWDENVDDGFEEETKLRLSKALRIPGDTMTYEYDMGDGWRHEVLLEKICPYDPDHIYPWCLDGKYNCPPEDC